MRADGPVRVAIITAEVGEGHLSAARALATELRAAADVEVVFVDALAAFGRVLRFILRDAYRSQLHRSPWIFAGLFSLFLRVRGLRACGRLALAVFGGRGLERALRAIAPDVVVSTYPGATSVLGSLRRRGRVVAPTCATITDLGGIAFWAHRSIDVHLVMHPTLVAAVEREAGHGSARVVRPLVGRAFFEARTRQDARAELGLPQDRRVVVVSGGGWAVGDLEGAAREALALPDTSVVCLAGRDEEARVRLSGALAGNEHAMVLGFTERMPELLGAADVVVHTTGGVTCLEALAVGCPLLSYGAPAGHSPTLARAMNALGVARYVPKRSELGAALVTAKAAPPPRATRSAADEVLAAQIRVPTRPVWRRRLRAVAVAAGVVACAYLAVSNEAAFASVGEPAPVTTQLLSGSHDELIVASLRDDAAGRAELERLLTRKNGLHAVSLLVLASHSV